jgi:hypothetical protein
LNIEPSVAANLNGGTLIGLTVLAENLGQAPQTLSGWARDGVQSRRLPTISLAGQKYTTVQEFSKFVADVSGWSQPIETGARQDLNLGRRACAARKKTMGVV